MSGQWTVWMNHGWFELDICRYPKRVFVTFEPFTVQTLYVYLRGLQLQVLPGSAIWSRGARRHVVRFLLVVVPARGPHILILAATRTENTGRQQLKLSGLVFFKCTGASKMGSKLWQPWAPQNPNSAVFGALSWPHVSGKYTWTQHKPIQVNLEGFDALISDSGLHGFSRERGMGSWIGSLSVEWALHTPNTPFSSAAASFSAEPEAPSTARGGGTARN